MRDYEQPPFAIEVEQRAGRTILNLSGELDIATVGELEDALKQRLDAGEDLVVDLRTLQFMDSSGVRALVAGHAAGRKGHGSLVFVRAQGDSEVDRVFEVMRRPPTFALFPDTTE